MKIVEIDKYVAEALIKIRMYIDTRIKRISESVYSFGVSFSNNMYDSNYIYEKLLNDIIKEKNLILLNNIIDRAISELKDCCRQVCLLISRYPSIQISTICDILDIQERTVYRRIEKSYQDLSVILNKCKDKDKILKIINSESWIVSEIESISTKRINYKNREKKYEY